MYYLKHKFVRSPNSPALLAEFSSCAPNFTASSPKIWAIHVEKVGLYVPWWGWVFQGVASSTGGLFQGGWEFQGDGNPIKLDVFRCVPCYIPSNDPE